ncbi:portal protein [Aneurinibacillus aneurinilyticus]|uniref:portal protein n=1 Tax=Aneurinibacillus aneurinilyticus TaxID=1391 RepID=UPI0023F52424|nr:portal protein [Aneurinibacillus aneurinilyticus]
MAKYKRGREIFDGNLFKVYERASELLKDTPHASQLAKLYIAVNLADLLLTKPADLLVGEPPSYETGLPDDSIEQQRLSSIVEENDLNQLLHEMTVANGYRGDAALKVYYSYRNDYSELEALGIPQPDGVKPEPIIESVDPSQVFPELSRGSKKRFKAVNIAWVETVETQAGVLQSFATGSKTKETYFLNVERHLPGVIVYERYKLDSKGVDTTYGVPISTYTIGERVDTGRENDVVLTGVNEILVRLIPYKSIDERWQGISGIEKMESLFAALNDRLVQIDYILWKHSDPTAYGPDLDTDAVRFGGKYIPVRKDEQTPGYMTWDSQLEGAFKELDYLLGLIYQQAETPQWLFGTTISQDKGGTGTSHTDSGAIKARFMPILSKVKRIRTHIDRAVRDCLYFAQVLENYANEGVDGFTPYEPVYPVIRWKDGIPKDEKEQAEIMAIRTNGKATLDVISAIKEMDDVNDGQAKEIVARIDADETRVNGTVDASIFNAPGGDN